MSVYFVKDPSNNYVKIGYSANPDKRIKSLQTGNPSKLSLVASINHAGQGMEKKIQNKFHHKRVRGEWFDISDKEIYDTYIEFCDNEIVEAEAVEDIEDIEAVEKNKFDYMLDKLDDAAGVIIKVFDGIMGISKMLFAIPFIMMPVSCVSCAAGVDHWVSLSFFLWLILAWFISILVPKCFLS